ncbi:hypothetical protein HNQ51_001804 [Inhella inkyongensis]|uniref:Uncharacterized protein n=1 Tax=Inhella inkyongensis TaxID=392593 RepID=A0A840S7R8_9BURK|nr:hypothetical protein [Inhella inkyongensis]MBB5204490.1 hypothetical protein [Inhella inkyongensis]
MCLWFWDAEEVGQALEALNWQPRNLRFSVESLYLEKPLGDGEVIRPCAAGAELWTLRHGIVQSSRWQMTAIEAPHPLRRAWASDLRPLDTRSNANLVQLVGAKTQRLLTWTPTTVLWLSLAWLAYHGAYWLGARQRLTILEAEAALADQRISSMASLGSEAKKDDEWLVQYKTFAASVPFDYVLEALRPALEHSGVVIKELELRGDQLRIQVTTAGGEIDLPALLKRLEAIHGFADVELREHTELTGATFGMKTTALKRLILPTSQKP